MHICSCVRGDACGCAAHLSHASAPHHSAIYNYSHGKSRGQVTQSIEIFADIVKACPYSCVDFVLLRWRVFSMLICTSLDCVRIVIGTTLTLTHRNIRRLRFKKKIVLLVVITSKPVSSERGKNGDSQPAPNGDCQPAPAKQPSQATARTICSRE